MNLGLTFALLVASPQGDSFGVYPVGPQPRALAAVDLDNDGRADVVTANFGGASLSILHNAGGGLFVPAGAVATSSMPSSIAAGDLSGDGRPDVIVLTSPTGGASVQLTIHLGTAGGGFLPHQDFNFGLTGQSVAVRDFDNDGALDAAILDNSGVSQSWIYMHRGNGLGGIAPPTSWLVAQTTGPVTARAAFADVNNDGTLDSGCASFAPFVTPFGTTYQARVHIATGAGGGFGVPQIGSVVGNYPFFMPNESADLADYDQDGKVDVFHPYGVVARGQGTANFGPQLASIYVKDTPGSIRAVKFSSDNTPDAVMHKSGTQTVGLLTTGSTGVPGAIQATAYLPCTSVAALELADVDGDGVADLLVADDAVNAVFRVLNDGNGRLRGTPVLRPETSFYNGVVVTSNFVDADAADFNLDGFLDIVTASASGIHYGNKLGAGGSTSLTSLPGTAAIVHDVEARDVDEDGKTDVLYTDYNGNRIGLARGLGNGSFAAPTTFGAGTEPTVVKTGDFNGDGLLDAMAGNQLSNDLSIFVNHGAGGFFPAATVPSKAGPGRLVLADLDGNGVMDAAVAATQAGEIVAHLGDGLGGFGAPITVLACTWPIGINAGDLDNNGAVDLAVVDFPTPSSALLQPLLGNGVGVYTPLPPSSFSAGNGPFVNLTLADLCSVGRLDAFVGAGGRPFLFVNDGTGQFQATSQGISQGGIGCSLALAADLDHDGRLDFVFGSVGGVSAFALAPPAKPPGASTFGNGTPGCSGIHGIDANVKAAVGASFIVTATNAPPSSLGLFLAGDAVNQLGNDPFGVGVALYIDFYASQQLVALDVVSDRNGNGSVLLAVPNAPQLAGLTVYSQVLFAWLGTGCTPSLFTLSSSRCLVTTIQP